ncbi:ATP-binding protein [Streptomyces chartreusis]|uniref:ATP-binding protein n=1 Tax=Streptomyces chartreusis TaxID=1969 RepID=UPI0037FD6F3F
MYARTASLTAQDSGATTTHQPGTVAEGLWDGCGAPQQVSATTQARSRQVHHTQYALPHCPQTVRAARNIAAEALDRWHVDEELSEIVLLVVSELVTNAVEHALPPLALHLIREPNNQQLRIEVVDGGPALASSKPTTSYEAEEHGRGLSIVDAVTTDHGTRVHTYGATHWASLPTST